MHFWARILGGISLTYICMCVRYESQLIINGVTGVSIIWEPNVILLEILIRTSILMKTLINFPSQ